MHDGMLQGWTAIHCAVSEDCEEATPHLVYHGANLNAQDDQVCSADMQVAATMSFGISWL